MSGSMNKSEFASIMSYLYTAYGRETNKMEMRVYYDILGIYSADQVMNAVRNWVSSSSFFPKVHDIKKKIQNQKISYEGVMQELHGIIALSPGQSFNKKDLHSVSYQLLKELGGKVHISQMNTKELEKQVRMKYNYVVDAEIRQLQHDKKPEIENRDSSTTAFGNVVHQLKQQAKA